VEFVDIDNLLRETLPIELKFEHEFCVFTKHGHQIREQIEILESQCGEVIVIKDSVH
jgi:hypothetical protein